jgi:hypothetical protein
VEADHRESDRWLRSKRAQMTRQMIVTRYSNTQSFLALETLEIAKSSDPIDGSPSSNGSLFSWSQGSSEVAADDNE